MQRLLLLERPKVQYEAINFRVKRDKKYILVADIMGLGDPPVVRLAAGGMLLLSGGTYQKVQPFQDPPSPPSFLPAGFAVPYRTGLILYIGRYYSQYLAQINLSAPNKGYILIRCVKGTVTVPVPDGLTGTTNGSVSGSTVTLTEGQYAIYGNISPLPAIGTVFTNDIEAGTGADVTLFLVASFNGGRATWKLNMGAGSFRIYGILDPSLGLSPWPLSLVLYNVPAVGLQALPPGLPLLPLAWEERLGILGAVIAVDMMTSGPYLNDPNVTTWAWARRAVKQIRVFTDGLPADFTFGFGIFSEHYDSTNTHRYDRKYACLYAVNIINPGPPPQANIVKLRQYQLLNTLTDVYNYDKFAVTTGFANANIQYPTSPQYFPPNQSIVIFSDEWFNFLLSSNFWTWIDGYWAFEATYPPIGGLPDPNNVTLYSYGKFIAAGANMEPQSLEDTYRISNYYLAPPIYLYFYEWGDKTLPAGWQGGLATEFWYSFQSIKEDTPAPAVFDNTLSWAQGILL
jgi:hypothetical protein